MRVALLMINIFIQRSSLGFECRHFNNNNKRFSALKIPECKKGSCCRADRELEKDKSFQIVS
jgi:hypothetical protein